MATFVSIREKVKAILDGISDLSFVADFHDGNVTGFPAATFDISEETSEFLTNKENLRTITFEIVLQQEIKVAGLGNAKRILDQVTLKVIDAFANDFSLDGEVDWCTPLVGPRGQFEGPSGSIFFQQLNLECRFTFLTT